MLTGYECWIWISYNKNNTERAKTLETCIQNRILKAQHILKLASVAIAQEEQKGLSTC